ncbi:MAG: phenylalanine--tRNA ligase subunit alpha, partial [Candidatus Aenigmarchaeota archaeon]|nr:phenylalanine--tRNA ligase subunit alpha [Candidatus Aenigmarchaeota archaeon]
MRFRLTEEGEKYLKEGLPEKNLVNFLKKERSLSLSEAKEKIKNFPIALLWAKKNNWVKVENNKIILICYPEKIPQQDALKAISRGEKVGEDLIKTFLFRKLIEKVKIDLEKLRELEGKKITHLTPELIKTGFWKKVKLKPYRVEIQGKKIYPGKRHPYIQFLNLIRKKLVELGFKEMTGPTIEFEFWNYDALFQPQDHPARDWFSTYRLKNPKHG